MIRKTQLDDLPVIWELMNDLECIEFPYELFCDAFEAVYSNPYMHMFVYEANKTVLSCLNMRIDVQLHHSGFIAEINDFVMNASCRGKGYGSALLNHAEAYAIEKGALQLELTTNKNRIRAHEFYTAHGFESTHYKFVKML
ncbi:GNAT family N-acetyltransferase [Erysipelothrix rhusiopathiae]|nr:GNAT family N-acetyltransferase [Erysipelothrix rhusiopathiae]MDE8202222.1 GNAT family N-acetyltransferase [Erysipelothrix rhusiopathiae]MDE8239292.1 GNAT family N-acetyltransferase [Erysipelothrix rhusiopathiae]MDE8254230.1 GNAT family N-acetyltransferase [Erysipelothrix rhusiopathiae]MDE8262645.1 GNAT family N-acetyltransferase [Erysipelothrix rhusiopathiae]